MVQWIVGSILHGGPIELFLVLAKGARCCSVVRVSSYAGKTMYCLEIQERDAAPW